MLKEPLGIFQVRSLAFSPDGKRLAVGYSRGAVRVLNVASVPRTSTGKGR